MKGSSDGGSKNIGDANDFCSMSLLQFRYIGGAKHYFFPHFNWGC